MSPAAGDYASIIMPIRLVKCLTETQVDEPHDDGVSGRPADLPELQNSIGELISFAESELRVVCPDIMKILHAFQGDADLSDVCSINRLEVKLRLAEDAIDEKIEELVLKVRPDIQFMKDTVYWYFVGMIILSLYVFMPPIIKALKILPVVGAFVSTGIAFIAREIVNLFIEAIETEIVARGLDPRSNLKQFAKDLAQIPPFNGMFDIAKCEFIESQIADFIARLDDFDQTLCETTSQQELDLIDEQLRNVQNCDADLTGIYQRFLSFQEHECQTETVAYSIDENGNLLPEIAN